MPPIPLFIALADPTRCRIVEMLREGPQPVHVLAAEFVISRPAISRHLRVLKQARLISEKKIGRENLYRLHAKRLEPAGAWIEGLLARPTPIQIPTPKKPPGHVPPKAEATAKPVSQMGFEF